MHSKCIDIDKFIAYLNKNVSKEDRQEIEDHLSYCDRCLEMVAMTSQIVKETNLSKLEIGAKLKAKEIWNNIKEKANQFYQWNKDQLPPLWVNPFDQPVLVPVSYRSDNKKTNNENIFIQKSINDLSVEIFFERIVDNLVSIKIRVMKNNQITPYINIYMKRAGGGHNARQLKNPYVSFEELPFGKYHITFEQKNINIVEYEFEINEKGINGQ